MNNRLIIILAVMVFAIVLSAVVILNMESPKPALAKTGSAAPAPEVIPDSFEHRSSVPQERPARIEPTVEKVTPRPPPREPQPWERKLDEVLNSTADEAQTAQILINLLPGLPADGQAEYAEHIANLLDDKDYAKVMPIVKNPNISEEALDVLVTDLINREDATKLPALLDIAKVPNHPHRQEAVDDLELFLDEDHGTDWNKWQLALTEYLKKQAAEEAEENAPPAPPLPGARPLTQ